MDSEVCVCILFASDRPTQKDFKVLPCPESRGGDRKRDLNSVVAHNHGFVEGKELRHLAISKQKFDLDFRSRGPARPLAALPLEPTVTPSLHRCVSSVCLRKTIVSLVHIFSRLSLFILSVMLSTSFEVHKCMDQD